MVIMILSLQIDKDGENSADPDQTASIGEV